MPVCLHIVYVCFYMALAELSDCNREQKIYYLAFREKVRQTCSSITLSICENLPSTPPRVVPKVLAGTPQPPSEGGPTISRGSAVSELLTDIELTVYLPSTQAPPSRAPESASPSPSAWPMGRKAEPLPGCPLLMLATSLSPP